MRFFVSFFHKKVPFLANNELYPKFLKYALLLEPPPPPPAISKGGGRTFQKLSHLWGYQKFY